MLAVFLPMKGDEAMMTVWENCVATLVVVVLSVRVFFLRDIYSAKLWLDGSAWAFRDSKLGPKPSQAVIRARPSSA